MRDALASQDYLYTLVIKHADGSTEARVVGSIIDFLHAPDDPERALERLADPAVRIISLTITEGGYNFNQVTGAFDAGHPDVSHDLKSAAAAARGEESRGPRSVFGLVVEALRRRRDLGIAPFTVVSCDNIQGNGHIARQQFVAYAMLLDPDLAGWISRAAAFPNSMVDRITPTTTPDDRQHLAQVHGIADRWPVVCEPFTQWALAEHFAGSGSRPPVEAAGVQVVEDAEPYETALAQVDVTGTQNKQVCDERIRRRGLQMRVSGSDVGR